MGTTSSITVQSLGKIAQCAPTVDAKMWCLFFFHRQDAAKRKTAGIKFTHRPKIRFFASQGRLVAPIHVKLGRADGHMGLLGWAKFHLNRRRGWECGPQNIKNFHFSVKSRLPWSISKIFRGFYTPNDPTLAFQIWCDSHHRLRSYCWETERPSIRPNYFGEPVGKTVPWIKKWMTSF